MKPKIKKKWLAALRSGKYKQGQNFLKKENNYCCLGVLCDIYSKEHPRSKWAASVSQYGVNSTYELFLGERDYLPFKVATWAGLKEPNPICDKQTLSEHNDNGKKFPAIANLIEKYL